MANMRIRVLALATLAGLVLGACGADSSSKQSSTTMVAANQADVVVTANDNNQPQTLRVGQRLDVEVSAPTGTNYSWSVREGYNTQVVIQDGAPVVVPTKPGMPGAPAATTFRFLAVGSGATEIDVDLRDNATGSPAESVRVPVMVTA
jgi:predicted secreted protein